MDPINQSSKRYKGVIFDLDGTLLDTAEGVLASVRYTTKTLGYPPLSDEVMRTFIGPPVKRSLIEAYHLDEEEANRATEVFRDRYKDYDLLKARPYDGIMALLGQLKHQGYLVGVATLKRDDYAHTLLKHFGIDRYCDAICGSDFASKMRKADVLNNCLQEIGLSAGEAVLIGDTSSDGTGAETAGVDFLAVTYGFGYRTAPEWSVYHPVFTAENVKQIGTFLGIEVKCI